MTSFWSCIVELICWTHISPFALLKITIKHKLIDSSSHFKGSSNTPPREELNLLEVVEERNKDDIANVPERISSTRPLEELNLLEVEGERNKGDEINVPEYLEIVKSPSFEMKRGKIKIERLLGSGNFCEVYKATSDNDTVAVKCLKGETFHITLSLWGAVSTLAMTVSPVKVVESVCSFSMFDEWNKAQLYLRFSIRLFSMQKCKTKPFGRIRSNNNCKRTTTIMIMKVLFCHTVIIFFSIWSKCHC